MNLWEKIGVGIVVVAILGFVVYNYATKDIEGSSAFVDSGPSTEIYVNADFGDDNNSGDVDSPLKTIDMALAMANQSQTSQVDINVANTISDYVLLSNIVSIKRSYVSIVGEAGRGSKPRVVPPIGIDSVGGSGGFASLSIDSGKSGIKIQDLELHNIDIGAQSITNLDVIGLVLNYSTRLINHGISVWDNTSSGMYLSQGVNIVSNRFVIDPSFVNEPFMFVDLRSVQGAYVNGNTFSFTTPAEDKLDMFTGIGLRNVEDIVAQSNRYLARYNSEIEVYQIDDVNNVAIKELGVLE